MIAAAQEAADSERRLAWRSYVTYVRKTVGKKFHFCTSWYGLNFGVYLLLLCIGTKCISSFASCHNPSALPSSEKNSKFLFLCSNTKNMEFFCMNRIKWQIFLACTEMWAIWRKTECTISAISVYNTIFIEICHNAKSNSTIKGFLN